MNRTYIAVIEARGKEMARSKPMLHHLAMRWIEEQKKQYKHLLYGPRWSIYLLTMSQPDPKKADFSIRKKDLSEHEKTINKYL